ncbi:MAG: phosphoribosylglycinamide formyltransferase [Clostridia bacterium]|nr:phosphoribosylglycinamide formyltransferase [Clostridia bacterium]NCC74859.1 phosphoribosylglycinamide formyltransferase [Clostridia bacterium]
MFKLAIFVSGGGTNLQAILDQIAAGHLPGVAIACVLASKPGTYAQVRAERAGIPCHVVARREFPDLVSYDQAILAALKPYAIDLVVLAGFLSLLGPDFIAAYRNTIINIHPSLIPAFCGPGLYGIKPHQAALAYGVKVSGATVHFVDEQYDEGPILLQKAVDILEGDTPEDLQQRIMTEAEQVILPQAIALIAAGRVQITDRRTQISPAHP